MQKILIVDDAPTNLKLLVDVLKNPDYKIYVATSGAAALKMVASNNFALILLDIVMPEMDGYELCSKLKANAATKNIPVIFITTQDTPADETKGFELGAVDYIAKPFSMPTVRARVKTHLKLKRVIEELENKNAALEEIASLREHVYRISRHDLKSPLNGIIGCSGLIAEDDNLTPKQIRMLKMIEESGYKMLGMINRSLDLYKMETGTYQYQPTSVNILSIIHKVIIDMDNLSVCQTDRLSVAILLGGKPVTEEDRFIVQGEQLLCYSMFANLIKNALEASPEAGRITVSLDKKETAIIRIHNKGAVPVEIRDKFFDKYSTFGKTVGTGLGTYSARLMANTLGGSIYLDTSEESGTTVTVELQIRR